MIASTLHIHTRYCDGKTGPREMCERAMQLGFVSLGFSEHASQTLDVGCGMSNEAGYIAEIRALQTEYAGKLRIHLGTEIDRYGVVCRDAYDYVIGSAHYVMADGQGVGVDGDPKKLEAALHGFYAGDGLRMAADYYRALIESVQMHKADVIGHFDLIRKYNERLHIFDETDPAYCKIAFDAMDALRATGAFLEVNTGGMARGYINTPYPSAFLLKRWRELGGDVVVGSDSHHPDTLDFAFDQVPALLRETGFDRFFRLSAKESELFEAVSL